MKKNGMKLISLLLALVLCLSLCACGGSKEEAKTPTPAAEAPAAKVYKVGVCNYVSDASLNQIVENIESRLLELAKENGVTIEILDQNANADAALLQQIVTNFIDEGVDLMVGVATPVAVTMQTLTEDTDIPVVFAAVSDPVGAGLVDSMEVPGGNVTGTSDGLNVDALLKLMDKAIPDCGKVALLYDLGQDSSNAAISQAKEILTAKGMDFADYTGTTTDELKLAVDALIADGCTAVFTPTDNSVMTAELAIYETLAEAGVAHFAGADSFALNGALVGYGVNYIDLGKATAEMVLPLLLGASPAETPVRTFDNGIATVNTETCTALGLDYDTLAAAFAESCSAVNAITTAESFD